MAIASPTATERPTSIRWLVFGLACGMSFALYLHRYTWGFIRVKLGEELGWTNDTLGWLDSAFMISYAAAQIPSGMLGDWFGPRVVLAVIAFAWSLSMGAMALARGFASLAWVRVVFGLAQAGCYPNLGKATKTWFPPDERTTVQGWVSSFSGRMGGAASFLLFGSLMLGTWDMPWRTALGWLTATGAVFAGLFLVLFRNSPAEHPWANAAEAELITSADPEAAVTTRSMVDWGRVFRNRSVWVLLFQQFTCTFVDMFFALQVPKYLKEIKDLKMQTTGWMAALPLVGGALGGMLAGGMLQSWLIRVTGNRRWTRSSVGLVGNLLAGACLFISLQFDSAEKIVAAFFCLKFFADWAQPTNWAVTTDMGGRNAASLFALVNTSGSLAAVVSGPAMGYTIEWFGRGVTGNPDGWRALLIGIGAIYIISALSWLFIDCTHTLDQPAQRAK